MKAFAFQDYKSGLWEVLFDNGTRFKHEFYTNQKAKELLPQWYGRQGHDIEFVQKPWLDGRVKAAQRMYEIQNFLPWDGRIKDDRPRE